MIGHSEVTHLSFEACMKPEVNFSCGGRKDTMSVTVRSQGSDAVARSSFVMSKNVAEVHEVQHVRKSPGLLCSRAEGMYFSR